MSASKPRRWQRGERAICSCPEWPEPAECDVMGGSYPPQLPTVERDGQPHLCPTAQLARAKVGRPRLAGPPITGDLPRIDPALAAEMRAAARREGVAERTLLERAIAREIREIEKSH